jgi:hypothetical protein
VSDERSGWDAEAVRRLVMRTIIRRVAKLEDRIAPKPTAQDRRLAEIAALIRERRRRYLEAEGLPFEELPPLDYKGPPMGIAETLRAGREQRLKLEAARVSERQR